MIERSELLAGIATKLSYWTSIGLIAGGVLDFLNQYASAMGILLGFMTFLVNWGYRHKSYQLEKARIHNTK